MITKNTILFFKNSFLGFLLLTLFNLSAQQNQLISGNISDVNSNPIPGVNILEQSNPRNGTVSDFDGNFTISIAPNSTLTFSYVGY
ncbi:MAG: carboxypeptidase-like regulatory domain-containing protein, partial [Flavobacteriales bacterium]